MSADLKQLVGLRSQLTQDVLDCLDDLAGRMAELPPYYPEHLRSQQTAAASFDDLRQTVQVAEDRSEYERWLAEDRERRRAAGQEMDQIAYDPTRSRPEDEPDELSREKGGSPPPPPPVPWDEHAGTRFHRAVVLGDPGFGKTWLLRYEARRLARTAVEGLRGRTIGLDDMVLPIFARLSDLSGAESPLEDVLVGLVGKGRSGRFRRFARNRIETDRCAILLDAWDEAPLPREELRRRLDDFARRFPLPRILMTSRIVGYDSSVPPLPGAQELALLTFDQPQIESFVGVWYGQEADTAGKFLTVLSQHHQIRGLSRIPLMLALICRAYQDGKLAFPTRRVDLYDRCLRGLLRDWRLDDQKAGRVILIDPNAAGVASEVKVFLYRLFAELASSNCDETTEAAIAERMQTLLKGLPPEHQLHGQDAASLLARLKATGTLVTTQPTGAYVEGLLELLRHVSLTLFVDGYEQFDESVLRAAMLTWLDGLKTSHELSGRKAGDLIEELKQDGILIASSDDRDAPLLFLHRTFQEYLAAGAIAERVNRTKTRRWQQGIELADRNWSIHELVDKKAWDPAWEEVIVLLTGQLNNPAPLLMMLRNPEPTKTNPMGDDIFRHRLCLAARCLPEIPAHLLPEASAAADGG